MYFMSNRIISCIMTKYGKDLHDSVCVCVCVCVCLKKAAGQTFYHSRVVYKTPYYSLYEYFNIVMSEIR